MATMPEDQTRGQTVPPKQSKGETPVTALRLPLDLKADLEVLAEHDNRSVSNLIVTVMRKWADGKLIELERAGIKLKRKK
jgi:hypothetical protein